MAITVGTDTYISVADANTYFTGRDGETTWGTYTDAEKENALRMACDYMEAEYTGRWIGGITSTDQSLSWPRYSVTDQDGRVYSGTEYPPRITDAQCELAYKAAAGNSLVPDLDAGEKSLIEKKTGPLTRKWSSGVDPEKRYLFVERLIAPFLTGSNSSVDLVRGL